MVHVIVGGYFNPPHGFHYQYINSAYEIGCDYAAFWERVKLHIIVASDYQVQMKESCPFYNQHERLRILSNIYERKTPHEKWYRYNKNVELYISNSPDRSVCFDLKAIYRIQKKHWWDRFIFCNGGDVSAETVNCQEMTVCSQLGIIAKFGVGGTHKIDSSSNKINKAGEWYVQKHDYVKRIHQEL